MAPKLPVRTTEVLLKREYKSSLPHRLCGARVLGLAALVLIGVGTAKTGQLGPSLPPDLAKVFEEGVQAEKAGQLGTAEKAFLRVLREGGKAAFVYNNLGTVYQQQRDHTRAVAQFRLAIRLDPGYAAPRILLGASLVALGKVREATRELEAAVKLAPREPLARLELARAYDRAGSPAGVVDQFQALRELAPDDPEYAYQLGRAYLKLSEGCVRQVMEFDPRSARAYLMRGEIHRDNGEVEQAIRAFERALEIDPAFPGIHLTLAEIDLEQGKAADALKELEQELTIVPESAAAMALKRKLEP